MKHYYGFEYADGLSTTTGEPNPGPGSYTGRLSTAGNGTVFKTKKQRDTWTWADEGYDSYGGREAVSRTRLRYLCRGMSKVDFEEYMENLNFQCAKPELFT